MSRRVLARDSGLSERYISQVELGRANISIGLLRQLARALGKPLDALTEEGERSPEIIHAMDLLRSLQGPELQRAWRMLSDRFGGFDGAARRRRVALVGLKGAGKSTLGAALARRLNVRFIELDREIERESGMPLGTLFELYGQPVFRRFERRCLERIVKEQGAFVMAVGGGLVAEPATYELLRTGCCTIWVKASPDAHMARVVGQGDLRPLEDTREAMADLREILEMREPLYRHADLHVDTTGRTVEQCTRDILESVRLPEPAAL